MEDFYLDAAFSKEEFKIMDLKLCTLILNDNKLFPWVILVPRRNGVKEIIDLNRDDQHLLMDEIALISNLMKKIFQPKKLNIAAFGNIVPQLHIHIIARFEEDKAWPNSVFGGEVKPYEMFERDLIIRKIKNEAQ